MDDQSEDLVSLPTKKCISCKLTGVVIVKRQEVIAYNDGAFVQDAFVSLSPALREQIVSGTHPACWDKLFPPGK